MIKQSNKIIPLNIVMTYPVYWGKYEILRDFIQNFYDAVGYKNWKKQFVYQYENHVLTLKIDDISFNYEWLLHIGASTKTSTTNEYAGYFGEGFKIASLCAFRDFDWSIRMESSDWIIGVTCIEEKIDNQKIEMLAYNLNSKEKYNFTMLTLSNISLEDFDLFKIVLQSFYCPENELLGEIIWESKECAVYTRSNKEINYKLPITRDFGSKGAVFCGYQMLGTNPFDLVMCLHKSIKEDRERRALYRFQVIQIFEKVSDLIDPEASIKILEKMRKYWNSYPKKAIDLESWSYTINNLINNITKSQKAINILRNNYNNLLCLPRIYTMVEKNRRWQARTWLSTQSKKYILVKDTFMKLGYSSLEDECEKNGGFVVKDDVNTRIENKCFKLLEKICKQIYKSFFVIENWPSHRIIVNDEASCCGMAVVRKKKNKIMNIKGIYIRYNIDCIYLKKSLITENKYYRSLSTYIHELCHIFGGDSSSAFSNALTDAMEIMIQNIQIIVKGETEWRTFFGKNE